MIIDCHGHFTTEPKALLDFRARQVKAAEGGQMPPSPSELHISDDDIRVSLERQDDLEVLEVKIEIPQA